MDIKLIAVDLDGTLLNERKEIPNGFFTAVEMLHERGVRVVIASGRQYFNLKKLFAPLQNKLFFVCENGALVFDGDHNILCCAIPPEQLALPFRMASEIPTAHPLLCGAKSAWMFPPDPEAASQIKLYYEERTFSSDPFSTAVCSDSIVKIAVFDREDAEKNCSELLERFGSELKVTLAGKQWLDMMRKDVNKGVAISFLRKHLGLMPENCMAFGDYMNDYEMLQQVHYSYAMKNAHPDLIPVARFLAPSNADNGVMRVLDEYFPFLHSR